MLGQLCLGHGRSLYTDNKNCTYIVNSGRQEDDDAGDVKNKDGGKENQHDDCAAERKGQL